MAITVTGAASSKQLTTVANFKEMMGISGSSDDTFIGKVIDRASQAIVDYCGREFAKETITETIAGAGQPLLFLSRTPVVTLTSVSFDGDIMDTEDYELQDKVSGRIYNKGGYWRYTGYSLSYSFVYEGGYILPSMSGTVNLPDSVQAAALELSKILFVSRKQDSSVKSESVPDVYSVDYGGGSSQAGKSLVSNAGIVDLLSPYRRYKL